ncbi:hypothetical protein ACHAXS_002659 [Conticribra weissflogii]
MSTRRNSNYKDEMRPINNSSRNSNNDAEITPNNDNRDDQQVRRRSLIPRTPKLFLILLSATLARTIYDNGNHLPTTVARTAAEPREETITHAHPRGTTSFFSPFALPPSWPSSPNDPRHSRRRPSRSDDRHLNDELASLAGSHDPPYACPPGLTYLRDHVLDDDVTHPKNHSDGTPARNIPRILHFTFKSRCVHGGFVDVFDKWKERLGWEYSIFVHDDAAVDRLLFGRNWREFPELKQVMGCVTSGAAKADIWRYVLVWEYGGVYSDFDSAPNKFDANSISPKDDAFFPLEKLGIPAQYFFAASPRHPVMFLSAKHSLNKLSFHDDIGNAPPAVLTGPGAFKTGFLLFQRFAGYDSDGYATEGVYPGFGGRSVRVVGDKNRQNDWIRREAVPDKKEAYEIMNMTHFHDAKGKFLTGRGKDVACLRQRWDALTGVSDWNMIV